MYHQNNLIDGRWKNIKKALLIIGGIILVIIVIAAASGGSKTNQSSTSTSQAQSETAKPVEESKPKEFVTVVDVSGNANKNTDTFELKGGKVKLTYTFNGDYAIVGAIYILKEGTDLNKSGGIPEVTVTNTGTDSTFVTKSAGKYYLSVKAANASWNIKVEEER